MKVLILFAGAVLCGWAQQSADGQCAGCHDVDQKVSKSAHHSVGCTTCHAKHEEYPHPANILKPECGSCHTDQAEQYSTSIHSEAAKAGKPAPDCTVCHGAAHEIIKPASMDFRSKTVDTCGMCHDKIADQFRASVHGKALAAGLPQAPVCSDCHGEHAIKKHDNVQSSVFGPHVADTCGRCHGDVRLAQRLRLPKDRISSFQASFHGLALKSGMVRVANCASCHGVHNILPSNDPKSTINAKNLRATCGKCHNGAGERFAIGRVHSNGTKAEAPAVGWIRRIYLVLIPAVLGFMLLNNGGDWFRKLWRRRIRIVDEQLVGSREVRMPPLERRMHFLLLASFIVLTWTGFALLYPNGWWARPLLLWEAKLSLRSYVHRAASVVFIFVCFWHLYAIATNKRFRQNWYSLLPQFRDLPDLILTFLYNIGARKTKRVLPRHTYVAKMEYWAVVWGAVVMVGTGILMWANDFVLRTFNNTVIEIATAVHFYEAVLAAAAIVIWHFYFVIVDPDVYPLDTAFLNGISSRRRPAAEVAAEQEQADQQYQEENLEKKEPAQT